jgi:hypothetical protein
MARLDNPHRKMFSKQDFEQYPIWVWDDENEGLLPLSDSKYTTEYGPLFIKASFESSHHSFDGYLVGFHTFYAFFIFTNNGEIGFNKNLKKLIPQTEMELFMKLHCDPYPLFPLRYTSPIRFEDGTAIAGEFQLKDGNLICVPFRSDKC